MHLVLGDDAARVVIRPTGVQYILTLSKHFIESLL